MNVRIKTMIGNVVEVQIEPSEALKNELKALIAPVEKSGKGRVTDIIFDTL